VCFIASSTDGDVADFGGHIHENNHHTFVLRKIFGPKRDEVTPSGSIKCWKVLEWLYNWRLLNKGSAPSVSK
jgi:hypothetical protein